MDLAVYMIVSTFVVFAAIAAVALAWSIAAGQWHDLAGAANLVLAIDDPYPGASDSPAGTKTGA